MITIDHKTIKVAEDRQRTGDARKHVEQLKDSIKTIGLINPIVVRNIDNEKHLVAGFCRLSAIALLEHEGEKEYLFGGARIETNKVPVTLWETLSEADAFEIELEENLRRSNLTWREEAAAISQLHVLRKVEGARDVDIAAELQEKTGGSAAAAKAKLYKSVMVQSQIDQPQVKSAASLDSAYKAAMAIVEREMQAAVSLHTPTKMEIHEDNFLDWAHTYDDDPFSIILTDPPYGIDANKWGSGTHFTHGYDDTEDSLLRAMPLIVDAFNKVADEEAHLYLFCSFHLFRDWQIQLSLKEWEVWSTPLIWNKGTTGHIPHADFGPRRAYDVILYARRGEKQVTGVYSDVIDCSPIITEERVHAAQKPVALYMNLLKRSTNGGARVLDPFAGSGTIFKAAATMNCTAVGVELDPAQVQNCKAAIVEL